MGAEGLCWLTQGLPGAHLQAPPAPLPPPRVLELGPRSSCPAARRVLWAPQGLASRAGGAEPGRSPPTGLRSHRTPAPRLAFPACLPASSATPWLPGPRVASALPGPGLSAHSRRRAGLRGAVCGASGCGVGAGGRASGLPLPAPLSESITAPAPAPAARTRKKVGGGKEREERERTGGGAPSAGAAQPASPAPQVGPGSHGNHQPCPPPRTSSPSPSSFSPPHLPTGLPPQAGRAYGTPRGPGRQTGRWGTAPHFPRGSALEGGGEASTETANPAGPVPPPPPASRKGCPVLGGPESSQRAGGEGGGKLEAPTGPPGGPAEKVGA